MAKTERVVMLDTVEDSWAEPVENDKGGIDRIPHVDKLVKDVEYELPAAQAQRLKRDGFAEATPKRKK